MLRDIILKTCQETASTVASRMYPDDPKSAVELALSCLTETLYTHSVAKSFSMDRPSLLVPEPTQTPGQFPIGSGFGKESKFTQQVIIEALSEPERRKAL